MDSGVPRFFAKRQTLPRRQWASVPPRGILPGEKRSGFVLAQGLVLKWRIPAAHPIRPSREIGHAGAGFGSQRPVPISRP
jgi:hypothetical protein